MDKGPKHLKIFSKHGHHLSRVCSFPHSVPISNTRICQAYPTQQNQPKANTVNVRLPGPAWPRLALGLQSTDDIRAAWAPMTNILQVFLEAQGGGQQAHSTTCIPSHRLSLGLLVITASVILMHSGEVVKPFQVCFANPRMAGKPVIKMQIYWLGSLSQPQNSMI